MRYSAWIGVLKFNFPEFLDQSYAIIHPLIEVNMNTNQPLNLFDSKSRIQFLLLLGGALGIAAIFLPFTFDTSAFAVTVWSNDSMYKDMWRVAWPFFLPALIAIASARWLFSGKLSMPERVIAYLISIAILCITFSGYLMMHEWPSNFQDQIGYVFPFVILAFGLFTLLKIRKNPAFNPFGAIVSMQVAYLANCLLCLSSFFGEWQIGAYCSLVSAIAYLIQIILVWKYSEQDNSVLVTKIEN